MQATEMDTRDFNEEKFSAEEKKIQLVQEELQVYKKIETEKKVFHKTVVSEAVEIPVELRSENITVERFPKNEEINEIPQIQNRDGVTIIPVYEERAVVVKKLFLKEEIHIRKSEKTEQQIIKDTVRKEIFNEEDTI